MRKIEKGNLVFVEIGNKVIIDYKPFEKSKGVPKVYENKTLEEVVELYTLTGDKMKLEEKDNKDFDIEINGSLWINNVKIEYVDKMIVSEEEVEFYYKGNIVGNIQRKNIKSMIEQNYELSIKTDMIDNLIHLFDIRKEGDFGMVSVYDELCNFVTYNKKERCEKTIKKVLPTIFGEGTYAFEINGLYTSEKEILKRHIEPLPIIKFRKLTNLLCAEYEYIFIDFEAPDEVYGFNNIHDMLKLFNDLEFFDNLEKEDEEEIRRIIREEE